MDLMNSAKSAVESAGTRASRAILDGGALCDFGAAGDMEPGPLGDDLNPVDLETDIEEGPGTAIGEGLFPLLSVGE